MDSKEFTVPQPPKDWNERIDMTKTTLKKTGVVMVAKSEVLVDVVGKSTVKGISALGQGAKNLKEKHQDKPWAKKITGIFSKVSSTNNRRPSMSEDGVHVSSESSQDRIEEEKKDGEAPEEKTPDVAAKEN